MNGLHDARVKAAEARIAEAAKLHRPTLPGFGPKSCVHDGRAWPCETIAALDGAPEPEWEYVGMAFEYGGFMRIRNEHLTPEKFDSWRKLMAQYPRVEILKRVKAVPAGPWLPVEGEGK